MSLQVWARQTRDGAAVMLAKPWMKYVWLSLITLLAAALRFYKLADWSFWIDEIYTIGHATAHFATWNLILDNIPPQRNWVPVSVILTAQALNLWGVSEWSARVVSALIGVASVPILFFPTRKMFGDQVALLAVLLLAVSPWHVFWSQNARFYTSLLLFNTLALFAFYFLVEYDQRRYILLFYGLLYLGLSERLTASFILPVIVVYVLALLLLRIGKPKGLTLRNMSLLAVPVLIGGLLELYSWIAHGESRFFADVNWFLLYRNDDPLRLLGNITFSIGIPLMALAAFSGVFLITSRNRAGLLMTVNAFVPLAILTAANPFIFTKDRYVFLALFSWILLGAVAIQELFSHLTGQYKWLAVGVLTLLLLDASGDALLYYRVNHGNRPDWRAAFHTIEQQSRPDDVVVTFWPQFGPFYLDRTFVQYSDIVVPTLLESGKRYWFVLDAETIWANPEVKAFVEKHARLVDVLYLRTPDDFFLRVYLFDPQQPATVFVRPQNSDKVSLPEHSLFHREPRASAVRAHTVKRQSLRCSAQLSSQP